MLVAQLRPAEPFYFLLSKASCTCLPTIAVSYSVNYVCLCLPLPIFFFYLVFGFSVFLTLCASFFKKKKNYHIGVL